MNIDFSTIESLQEAGFEGFKTIESLWESNNNIPREKGVYLVLRTAAEPCEYINPGCGGFFKGKNPNVSPAELKENWVDDAKMVYVGKAGGLEGKATLYSRLNQYLKFGRGKNIGHWGGRLIWQLGDAGHLLICWKALPNDDPRTVEKKLIRDFVDQYGKRPFANLAD